MKKFATPAALAVLLSACSQGAPDAGLVSPPTVTTNQVYTTRGAAPQYLMCDRVDGKPASNFVTATFGFNGTIDHVDVELRGTRSGTEGPVYREHVDASDLIVGKGQYALTFSADASAKPAGASKGSGLRAESITVRESLPGARRVTPEGDAVGAFRLYLRPTSTTGSGPTEFVPHEQQVKVYANCTTN
ncbi:hypothetical protein [Deinococcus pimensis]|uniref:hypothetical protein n=1 Tax=Deinococcus pimensis TaxID=309888 RepID=UPI00048128F2|nr:hypothetical protein [Deinococcus pimensis]